MTEHTLDCLIVGAGPAGLQLAHFLHERGRSYLVLEQATAPGDFFTRFPRHRTLISSNKRHTGTSDAEFNLRMDWNSLLTDNSDLRFTEYTDAYFPPADEMPRYLGDFADNLKLNVQCGRRVVQFTRTSDEFIALDEHGERYSAKQVVIATGVSLPNIPSIPGIDLVDHYSSMSVDRAEFVDKRVLVIGKGNSAFETADHLIPSAAVIHVAGPNPVKLAWHTHFVGHLRAVNNNFLDTYQLKSQNAILDAGVLAITRSGDRFDVEFEFSRGSVHIEYDRVIACTGFRFDASIFDESCRPQLTIGDRFPLLTGAYESANVPGLYFAGTLTQQLDFKKGTNGFIHGFRYGARALFHIMEERHHANPWPCREIEATVESLAAATMERISRSSALWQQFQFMADVIVLPKTGPALYHEEVPVAYLNLWTGHANDDMLVVTLEYGHEDRPPFDGAPLLADARSISSYLHPVIRQYRDGNVVGEHHMASDLENDWNSRPSYRDRLQAFIRDHPAA